MHVEPRGGPCNGERGVKPTKEMGKASSSRARVWVSLVNHVDFEIARTEGARMMSNGGRVCVDGRGSRRGKVRELDS